MKTHPFGNLGDAAVTLLLLIALGFGVEARYILAVYLILEIISHIAKAFCAVVDPLITSLRPDHRR
jgi:hypothetical protein